jgi:DNA (cytosine-5)-methyltransferase 1
MAAYYNEIDPYAAEWLRNLIKAGHIAPGVVDERSIEDVCPSDLSEFTQCHFFAGIGVWSYALRLAGWPDDRPVWTGSCPCQPFSAAGKGGGFNDERHLWPAWQWLIGQQKPSVVFGEQVASKGGLEWLDVVCGDLEGLGHAVAAAVLPAGGFGAPHIRKRLFFAAYADKAGFPGSHERSELTAQTGGIDAWRELERVHAAGTWPSWVSESGIRPFADGVAGRVGKISAYGNAICPEPARAFIRASDDVFRLFDLV